MPVPVPLVVSGIYSSSGCRNAQVLPTRPFRAPGALGAFGPAGSVPQALSPPGGFRWREPESSWADADSVRIDDVTRVKLEA